MASIGGHGFTFYSFYMRGMLGAAVSVTSFGSWMLGCTWFLAWRHVYSFEKGAISQFPLLDPSC